MNFEDLGLELKVDNNNIEVFPWMVLNVKSYLPIREKGRFIEYVAMGALDGNTGTFSPVRVELFFALAVCKWYAGIEFGDVDPSDAYDLLETNGIIAEITAAIPKDEFDFLSSLTEETINDMSRFNSSAAGIIQSMSADSSILEENMSKILADIENAKGLEVLSDIKNVVGQDRPVVVKKG